MSEWFPVNAGLRQDCVMSPWLFNVNMDGVIREVNVRELGKGLELPSANGGRFEINHLLFADDTALDIVISNIFNLNKHFFFFLLFLSG